MKEMIELLSPLISGAVGIILALAVFLGRLRKNAKELNNAYKMIAEIRSDLKLIKGQNTDISIKVAKIYEKNH